MAVLVAQRNWECYDAIVKALKNTESDETLLVQSGKPVGVFKTHENSPRVLIANSNPSRTGPPGNTLTSWMPKGWRCTAR